MSAFYSDLLLRKGEDFPWLACPLSSRNQFLPPGLMAVGPGQITIFTLSARLSLSPLGSLLWIIFPPASPSLIKKIYTHTTNKPLYSDTSYVPDYTSILHANSLWVNRFTCKISLPLLTLVSPALPYVS